MAPNPEYIPLEPQLTVEDDKIKVTKRTNVINEEFAENKDREKLELIWFMIIALAICHSAALYGLWLMLTSAKILTVLFTLFLNHVAIMGSTAGAHRLWSHRSYKAKLPLRILLMVMQTIAYQGPIIPWAYDHRTHHKNSDTESDPHNSTRGFFYSHIGWMLCKKPSRVVEQQMKIDISDLMADPVLIFQRKYYYNILMPLLCFAIPTAVPVYYWNESLKTALFVPAILRWIFGLNITLASNSVAHRWGSKPYDKNIKPTEHGPLSILLLGEGWHNFHHSFPWDYRAAEFKSFWYNNTTSFINFFAKIGWAYDLKAASSEMVLKRVNRTGDGSREIWGWGDDDQNPIEKENAIVLNSIN